MPRHHSRRSSVSRLAAELAVQRVNANFNEDESESCSSTNNNNNNHKKSQDHTSKQFTFSFYDMALQLSKPDDPNSLITKRATFLAISLYTTIVFVIWGAIYAIFFNLFRVTILCWMYTLIIGCDLLLIRWSKSWNYFEYIQFFCIIFFPCAVQHELGGVARSGCSMLWGILAGVGGTLFHNPEVGLRWFLRFVVSCVLLLLCEYHQVPTINGSVSENMERNVRLELVSFAMNLFGTSAAVFYAAECFATELQNEYQRSESLLLNIFPAQIADRLKNGQTKIMENVGGITILFADLVGFTSASAILPSDLLIERYLREVFSAFDQLVERRLVEKIKTIGDAYMVASSTWDQANDDEYKRQAESMIYLASEFLEVLNIVNQRFDVNFEVRIGIHTGNVVAGVISSSKFAYDVWGETVNIASLLESHGTPSKIHISEDTYKCVKDILQFSFEPCGYTEFNRYSSSSCPSQSTPTSIGDTSSSESGGYGRGMETFFAYVNEPEVDWENINLSSDSTALDNFFNRRGSAMG